MSGGRNEEEVLGRTELPFPSLWYDTDRIENEIHYEDAQVEGWTDSKIISLASFYCFRNKQSRLMKEDRKKMNSKREGGRKKEETGKKKKKRKRNVKLKKLTGWRSSFECRFLSACWYVPRMHPPGISICAAVGENASRPPRVPLQFGAPYGLPFPTAGRAGSASLKVHPEGEDDIAAVISCLRLAAMSRDGKLKASLHYSPRIPPCVSSVRAFRGTNPCPPSFPSSATRQCTKRISELLKRDSAP
jgi:hypothetical protein